MSSQELRSATALEPLPNDLESAQAKLVYLYLEAAGGATVDELGETLSMRKLSILSVLNSLSSTGLVDERDDEYVVAN